MAELIAIVAPVYVCAGIGFAWVRSGRRFDAALMTDLVYFVGSPCLVFSSLVSQALDVGELRDMMVASLLSLAALAALGALVLRGAGLPLSTYLAPMIFGNSGNMGLPLCLFAFGDTGLALAIGYFATTTLAQFTAGQAIWSGRTSLGELVRSPLVWSVGLAVTVLATGFETPRVVLRTTRMLGDMTIPIMQLMLGVSLASLEVKGLARGVGLSVLKIGGGAAVGAVVGAAMGLGEVARGVLVLQCAMPVAVFNYMFAVRYGRAPAEVASVIVVSTLIALATTPLLLAFLPTAAG